MPSQAGGAQHQTALQHFSKAMSVPVLPANAHRTLSLLNDDFASLRQVADVLSTDPAISARLIALANSAYFAPANPVVTLEEAIIGSLGLDLTRGVALGMAVNDALDLSGCPAFDSRSLWQRAMGRSTLARTLAGAAGLSAHDELLATGGLLREIGMLAMVATWPQVINGMLEDGEQELRANMQAHFGFDADAATTAVLVIWSLPDALIWLMGGRHSGQVPAEVKLVLVAAERVLNAALSDGVDSLPATIVADTLDQVGLSGSPVDPRPALRAAFSSAEYINA